MLRDRLEDHLSNLKYRGLITTWYDREIRAGEEWAQQIDIYLNKAHIILLLISADFMASQYCYSIEMKQALERHERREADVIPILLRPVLFTDAPFAKLQMLPTNGKPVIQWRDRDSAFVDIAYGIERVAQKYLPLSSLLTAGEGVRSQALPPQGVRVPLPAGASPDIHFPPGQVGQAQPPQYPPQPRASSRPRFALLIGSFAVLFITAGIFTLLQHPTLIPLVGYILAVFLGLSFLIAGIVAAIKAIGGARKRRYASLAESLVLVPSYDRHQDEEEYRRRRYYVETIEAYRHALLYNNPSDGDAYRGMGNAYYALERYNEALNAFLRAIKCTPTSATAYAGLGNVYAELKQYNEAVAAYEKAIELDPTVTFNYDGFIQSLLAVGRKGEAEQAYARAKQLGYDDESK